MRDDVLKWNQKNGYTIPREGLWRKPSTPSYNHFFPDTEPDSKSLCGLIAYRNTSTSSGEIPVYSKCRSCEKTRLGIAHNAKGWNMSVDPLVTDPGGPVKPPTLDERVAALETQMADLIPRVTTLESQMSYLYDMTQFRLRCECGHFQDDHLHGDSTIESTYGGCRQCDCPAYREEIQT